MGNFFIIIPSGKAGWVCEGRCKKNAEMMIVVLGPILFPRAILTLYELCCPLYPSQPVCYSWEGGTAHRTHQRSHSPDRVTLEDSCAHSDCPCHSLHFMISHLFHHLSEPSVFNCFLSCSSFGNSEAKRSLCINHCTLVNCSELHLN